MASCPEPFHDNINPVPEAGQKKKVFAMFCPHCGAEINDNAVVCVKCGCAVTPLSSAAPRPADVSDKDWLVALLLCFFVGCLGIHRFYVGKTGSAIVQLITVGGCGIWTLIDFIVIAMGNFTDAEGKRLVSK